MVKTGEKGTVAAAKKNPSPDTVACIDLTGSGSDIHDFFRPAKERRLGSVRKELEPPSAKKRSRGGLKTTGLDDADGPEIIVIDSDDDEDIPMAYNDDDCAIVEVDTTPVPVASPPDDTLRPTKKAKSKETESKPLAAVKKEGGNKTCNKVDGNVDTEGVEVVEAAAPVLAAATMVSEQAKNTTTDEDVVVEGVLNETRLPHMRQHCTRCPFTPHSVTSSRRETNSNSCDLCYCYVCDCPVKDCKNWYSSTSTSPEDNHCCATEKERSWERMRSRAKGQASISGFYRENLPYYNSNEESEGMDESEDDDDVPPYHLPRILFDQWREQREIRRNSTYGLPGPFKPDHPDAARNNDLTKCRHCSWFIRLVGYSRYRPSSNDWCKVCGRVASEADLEKSQVAPANNASEEAQAGKYLLGEKEISFRIKAHDPRLFDEYKTKWEENSSGNSAWIYDQADRDEEVFLHRIGRSPTFDNIQNMIPRVGNENIPDKVDSSHTCRNNERDGTDAMIIEDPEELNLVYGLSGLFQPDSSLDSPSLKIAATWDKASRKGTLKLQLELPKTSFVGNAYSRNWTHLQGGQVMIALGIWCGLFPLKPSELCVRLNGLDSEEIIDQMNRKWSTTYNIPMSPYRVEMDDVIDTLREQLSLRLESLSSAKDEYESQLTMTSSDGSRFGGGVCVRDSSNPFRNSMIRLFSEHFPSMMSRHWENDDLVASCQGATRRQKYSRYDSIFGFETAIATQAYFESDASDCDYQKHRVSTKPSIKDLMVRVENLGHGSEDCVEGLKIELLEFQRQSLKWALECERTPNGVQSFFWSKIPTSDGQGDLYYHPILKSFRKDKPALVRGGFIAEQMGLGKTVISLALILKNPAPQLPLSGSSIEELKTKGPDVDNSESVGWDENLFEKNKGLGHLSNKKTGSIICRGTLVICPVSLVGQWIDEARSKLDDPGLIYPYHGSNRVRDPRKLAANSIVVTTYDILASDAFRRTKHSFGKDYCPPLQQIRWWRIICDEGHLLRESNTSRSKSVLSLAADNKWIVTGTPMNTSLADLKNQFRFLGFEHVEKLFSSLVTTHGRGNRNVEIDNLMYLLRPIMMRHSQQQKYRGTSTTLMSLPKKTERVQKITLTKSEKKEYSKIEKEAQKWYMDFRATNRKDISKHFLKISSKLTPLRISCSGGKYPLSSGNEDMGINRPNNERKYSNFAFESKFKVLLAKLEKIRDTEPDSKSLVFSQFSSTLDWLKVQLPKHGFQFRTLTGDMTMKKRAKALSDFQNDPPTTIFLLSMRSGAVGINLTQANRVFLMEPSFNPALEAQAIGRVHRLGQKRPVEIVKLIVKDSFEERMMKFLKKKYGSNSVKKPEEVSENEEKTNSNEKKLNSQAGNLKADKVQLVTEEFDTLFGVEDRVREDAPRSVGEDDDMKADAVPSAGLL